jgi:hypothetical protein
MFRRILQVLGILFILEAVLIAGFFAYVLFLLAPAGSRASEISNLEYIFNWSGLNPEQGYEVIASEQTSPAWNGDYSKWACIQLSDSGQNAESEKWRNGEKETELFKVVRKFAYEAVYDGDCFGGADINTADIEAYFWSASLYGRDDVEGATVIFVQKSTNRLLYVDWMS